jgi:hypothetical protein
VLFDAEHDLGYREAMPPALGSGDRPEQGEGGDSSIRIMLGFTAYDRHSAGQSHGARTTIASMQPIALAANFDAGDP